MPRSLPALIGLLASVLAVAPASAQDAAAARAEALIEEGIELRQLRRDAEAWERFDEAYRAHPTARALAQRGLASKAQSRWIAAIEDLTLALQEPDAWVEERRAILEQELTVSRTHVGTLEVTGPEGTRVAIAGHEERTLPTEPFLVEVGTIEVEVRPPGGEASRERVRVTHRGPNVLGVAPVATATSTGGGVNGGALGLGLGGGALLALGGVLLGVGLADVGAIQGTEDRTRPWDEVAADRDRAYALEGAGAASLGVGAALVIVAIAIGVSGEGSAR